MRDLCLVVAAVAGILNTSANAGGIRHKHSAIISRRASATDLQELYFSETLSGNHTVTILEADGFKLAASCKTTTNDLNPYSTGSASSFSSSSSPSSYYSSHTATSFDGSHGGGERKRARPTTTDNPPSTQAAKVVVVAVVVKVVVVEVMVVVATAAGATATRLGTIPLRRITLDRLMLAVMTMHPLAAPEQAAISLKFQRTAP
ncbi:unnamed protein product [Ectocarpus sp. 12 AP-2014]